MTHYDTCPIVADHWYDVTVVWDSDKIGGIPVDIIIDDQGPAGDDVGEAWAGTVNCTDSDQVLVNADRLLAEGDEILPANNYITIGANPSNGNLKFSGLIDFVRVMTY